MSPAHDGGVLRGVLSYLASRPFVACLDDDNWWRPDHLRLLRGILEACSLRWFVHPQSRRSICVDQRETVGPGRGIFQERFGGFVDPSCLMLNKVTCDRCYRFETAHCGRRSRRATEGRREASVLSGTGCWPEHR